MKCYADTDVKDCCNQDTCCRECGYEDCHEGCDLYDTFKKGCLDCPYMEDDDD